MSKFCNECGERLPYATAKFCSECGAPVVNDADQTKPGESTKKVTPEAVVSKPDKKSATSRKKDGKKASASKADKSRSKARKVNHNTRDELVKTILRNKDSGFTGTDQLRFNPARVPFNLAEYEVTDPKQIKDFTRLPRKAKRKDKEPEKRTWRLRLISANPEQKPLDLELYDNIVIGRKMGGDMPDLDLTGYGGMPLGVSRQHALLNPTDSGLYLIDLRSSNGTFCNGSRVSGGVPRKVSNGDVLSFSGLHFLVRVISQPKGAE